MRWFLLGLLDPDDRRAVLERELEHADAYAEMLRETAERIDAIGGRTRSRRRSTSGCAPPR